MIHVCVPVLKRYDLLKDLALSLKASVSKPMLHVIDNGLKGAVLVRALATIDIPSDVLTPLRPMGLAESWNWFIQNVPEERVIANDDVTFASDSLEKLVASDADLVWAKGYGFSCFLIRDSCIAKIGLFDETISPGYAYYEDEDYLQRLDGHGTRKPSARAADVECGIKHVHSATLKASTPAEIQEHHRKFKIAQGNYARKWHLEEAFEAERLQKAIG